jgi:hypothetical protein
LQRGRRVADQDRFEAVLVQYPGQREEYGAGVHAALIVRFPISGNKLETKL